MSDQEVTFGPPPRQGLSKSRRMVAEQYVERALAATSPLAVKLQRLLIQNALKPEAGPMEQALGFKASETILDRFLGKAVQRAEVTTSERPPIVFDQRLSSLNAAMREAIDVRHHKDGEGPIDAFAREVTRGMVDEGGLVI